MPSCHVPGRWWSPTLFPDLPALKGNPFLPWHLHSTTDALTAGTQEVGFSINYLHYLWVISTFLVIMQHMKSTFGSLKYKIPVWMPLRLDEVRERLKEQVASLHDKRCARNAISGSKRPKRRLDPSSSSTCATLDELLVEWLRWDLQFSSSPSFSSMLEDWHSIKLSSCTGCPRILRYFSTSPFILPRDT